MNERSAQRVMKRTSLTILFYIITIVFSAIGYAFIVSNNKFNEDGYPTIVVINIYINKFYFIIHIIIYNLIKKFRP